MSEEPSKTGGAGNYTREELQSALFAQLVMQQSNMALMLMGKVAHPQTGETVRDLESAQLFVEQLEMLDAKTKGNLSKQEEALLKQTLLGLRMAFVEAVEKPEQAAPKPVEEGAKTEPKNETAPSEGAGAESGDEPRKRFSKKF